MTINECNFVKMIVNYDKGIQELQDNIKENFNINSEYDDCTNTLHLFTENIKDSLQLVSAKNYILSKIDEGLINVEFGRKKEEN